MSATGPAVAAAMLATAAAVLPARPGRGRWRTFLTAPAPAPAAPSLVRPAWIVLGCGAATAMGWVISGVVGGIATAVACGLGVGAVAVLRTLQPECFGAPLEGRRATAPDIRPIDGLYRGARVADPADGRLARERRTARGTADAAELAGCWEMLAACLEAGLPVSTAVLATAGPPTGTGRGTGPPLRRVAGLLELGADPADAWHTVEQLPELAAFARAAARSAGTGSALAKVARTECARLRATLADTAQARAQRAAVLITGPLGICFLPAFLALGVAPVVIGLASEALARW